MKITRYLLTGICLLASAFAALVPKPPFNPLLLSRLMKPHPGPRMNVLLLIADDLNCNLGCYGSPGALTPHIDQLATRGVRFDRAYCQIPLCSPSRSSFLTGRRPDVTGIVVNPDLQNPYAAHFRMNIPDTVTLPEGFRTEGWFTARVGKVYHFGVPYDIGSSGLDDIASWDLAVNPRGRDRELHDEIYSTAPERVAHGLGGAESGFRWFADEKGKDADYTDGIGATEAVKLLERFQRESRPFFLAVGFYRPHTPLVAPKSYFDQHPPEAITLPSLSADDRARRPEPAYATWRAEWAAASDPQRRGVIQAYDAVISFMDAQVGRVVEAVDRLGLASTTVIVFISDHGYHLGDHALWQKLSLFERSARVPLIIVAPGAKANGRATQSLAELVDLYPTLADLCGVTAPDYLAGKSLRPILDDVTASVKDAAFSQIRTRGGNVEGYTVRTDRWRYLEWNAGHDGAQLFDLVNDPGETTNLAKDPKLAATVTQLHSRLADYRKH